MTVNELLDTLEDGDGDGAGMYLTTLSHPSHLLI